MNFSPRQLMYIEKRLRDLDIFLSGDPRTGDINAKLEKQWLQLLLNIDNQA